MSITDPDAWMILPCVLSSSTSPPQEYLVTSKNASVRPDRSIMALSVSVISFAAVIVSLPLGRTIDVDSVTESPMRSICPPSAADAWLLAEMPAGAVTDSAPPAR